MDPDLARAVAFVHRLENRLAGELAAWDGGTAVINRRWPDMWDINFLRLERPWPRSGEALASAVDDAARAVGIATPVVAIAAPDDVARLGPALEAAGFERDAFVVMAWRREAGRGAAPEVVVEELRYDDVRDDRRAMAELPWKSGEAPSSPELVKQVLALESRVADLVDDHWYAVRSGDGFAAMCRLMSADGVGQVEYVTTLPDHRGRGYASAVVEAAVEASRAVGNDLTFIEAHEDDWPRELYGRLGFEEIGSVVRFRRAD
jgi:GNAT superfamily N-acetyltransferase